MDANEEQPETDSTRSDGRRQGLSRRTILGGMAATGAAGAAAAPFIVGCNDQNGTGGGGAEPGPPGFGTGINDGFDGKIELDVRDSKPDWTRSNSKAPRWRTQRPDRALRRHRTGFMVAVRRRINMPTLQKLADDGLRYSQWHTTTLCSPTRSCMLTGRNHHVNRFASITEGSDGFPRRGGAAAPVRHHRAGAAGQRLLHVLDRQNHNVPGRTSPAAAASRVATGQGLRPLLRFPRRGRPTSGFPTWSRTTASSSSLRPGPGLPPVKDLADNAIRMLRDQNSSNPSKPWYMWFCPPTTPRTTARRTPRSTRSQFDDGYEAYREWVLQRT